MPILKICVRLFGVAILLWGLGTRAVASGEALGQVIKYGVETKVVVEDPEATFPATHTMPVNVATHHVEVISRFAEGNPYGGTPGAFFPYLHVTASFVHEATGRIVKKRLYGIAHGHRPGLHYGTNLRLPEKGKYGVTITVDPPSDWEIGRHNDVKGWFEPITIKLQFVWK